LDNQEYYTTKEVANMIEKSVPTIHKYVEQGKLTPVEDLWGGHRGLLFEKEQIERFIQEMPNEKPGLTLNEAADHLQTNRSTVQTYLNEGLIPYTKQESHGREVTFIKQTDLKEFSELGSARLQNDRLKQRHFFNRKKKEAVFQRFSSPTIPEARLFRRGLGEWYFFVPQTDQTLSYKELSYEEGIYEHKLKADYPVEFGKRSGTPGYAKMKMPLRYSLTYQFVDLLYQYAHVANMYMDIEKDRLIVLVKDCVFFDVSEELASFIKSRTEQGQVRFQRGVLAIESEEETLSVRLSRETKQWIKQFADENGTSMQDIASQIIEDRFIKVKNQE
jgi:transposase